MAWQVATHEEPVWRARANFVIRASIEDGRAEQLWARKVSEIRFEICCIPFFAYDLALGDIVETATEGERQYMVQRVVEPSSHYTFRVWFEPEDHPSHVLVTEKARELGCLWEWFGARLMSLDAPEHETARKLADALWQMQNEGRLQFETGLMKPRRAAEPPSDPDGSAGGIGGQ